MSGPVRGTYNAEGKFFAVMGSTLYRISNAGIAIPVGTVPGLGRVSFTHNQISLGNEVVVVNGSAGYVYNTVTDTFGRITDPGYPGSAVAAFIDGYVLGIEPQGRYAFNSRPAAATDYNTLDRFTSEVSPDRLVSLGVTNNELLLLSASSGEFFQNEGRSEQPFRSKRITMDKGCGGAYTVVNLDNSLCWLGDDGRFYKLESYSPRRISTRPIEQAIAGLNWERAFGFAWEDEGYEVAYWTFPDGKTWGWDASNGEWHRRESFGLNRWRVNSMTRWRGEWYAGDFQGPRIWKLDWDYPWEGDQEFVSERTCAVMHDDQSRVNARRLELVMDTGMPDVEPVAFPVQPEGPTISGDAPDYVRGSEEPEYVYQYTVGGGTGTLKVKVKVGTLPPGLTLSADGELTGDPTTNGSYSFTVRVTDENGLWAEVVDTILISQGEIISDDTEYRYLQIPLSDTTDYSDPDFDDSAWDVGESPFANAVPHPYAASVGWPNVKNTNWDLSTRLWLRAHFTLEAPEDLTFYVFVDNYATVWVNGELVLPRTGTVDSPSGPIFNHQAEIPASMLVAGDNVIAVLGEDFGSYAYMACRVAIGDAP